MVARTKNGPGLRVVFFRAGRELDAVMAVHGRDARDGAIRVISRQEELLIGDQLIVLADEEGSPRVR